MLCLSFADFCRTPDTQIAKCGVIYHGPKVRHPRYTCKFCSLVVHSSTTAGYPYSFFYLNPAATCIQACLTIWVSKINGDIDRHSEEIQFGVCDCTQRCYAGIVSYNHWTINLYHTIAFPDYADNKRTARWLLPSSG